MSAADFDAHFAGHAWEIASPPPLPAGGSLVTVPGTYGSPTVHLSGVAQGAGAAPSR